MSNLPSKLPSATTSPSPLNRARKRRAKRGIVANYIHEISPRHRAASTVIPAVATPVAEPAEA